MTVQPNDLTCKVFLAEAATVNEYLAETQQPAAAPSAPADADLRERIAQAVRDTVTRVMDLRGFDTQIADAVLAVLPTPVDRPAVLREVADECGEAGSAYTARAQNEHAAGAFALMEHFRRKANEAEYAATPCSVPNVCEDGGEACTTHERLMAHAEGDHELCEPDCGPSRMTDEAQQAGEGR